MYVFVCVRGGGDKEGVYVSVYATVCVCERESAFIYVCLCV